MGGVQLHVRLRGRGHAGAAAGLRTRCSRRAALHVRALERQRLSQPRRRRGDPAADASGAPEPRHGGDRSVVLTRPCARARRRPARPHLRPGTRRSVRRAWPRLVRPPGRNGAVGRRAGPRTRASPAAVRRAAGRCPRRGRRLHRSQVAVHGRAQPPLCGAGCGGGAGARSHRGGRGHRPPCGAGARLRHDGRAELDLGQAGPADAGGVRPGRAAPDGDRADAAAIAGARPPQPGRLGSPREVRRIGISQAPARGRRRPGRLHPGGDGDVRGA